MGMQIHARCDHFLLPQNPLPSLYLLSSRNSIIGQCRLKNENRVFASKAGILRKREAYVNRVFATSNVGAPLWENWGPEKSNKAPSISDVFWPSAG